MAAPVRPIGLTVDGDMPDGFALGARQRRRQGGRLRLRGHLSPGTALRGHAHADGGAHARPHRSARAALVIRGVQHRLGLGILAEAVQIADDPHRGALVEDSLNFIWQADVFDVKFRDRQPILRTRGRDGLGHHLAQLIGIRRHIQHRNATGGDHARELLHDDIAQLEGDFVAGEFAIGADDLGHEFGRVGDAHRIGAEGADADRAEFGVACDDRVLGAPFQIVEPRRVDEVDFRLEGRFEAVIPMLKRGQDRHVVGFEDVQPRPEHVGDLALMDEDGGLTFANGQLGAVFDGVAAAFKPPDHRVAGVVGPFDDVDELAREEIEQGHGSLRGLG